jgi:hypothetical protein
VKRWKEAKGKAGLSFFFLVDIAVGPLDAYLILKNCVLLIALG